MVSAVPTVPCGRQVVSGPIFNAVLQGPHAAASPNPLSHGPCTPEMINGSSFRLFSFGGACCIRPGARNTPYPARSANGSGRGAFNRRERAEPRERQTEADAMNHHDLMRGRGLNRRLTTAALPAALMAGLLGTADCAGTGTGLGLQLETGRATCRERGWSYV